MLVLSRKLNERIVIGNNIRITVVGIRGNQVRLGIEAPDWVKVFREELIVGADGTDDCEIDEQLKGKQAEAGAAVGRAIGCTTLA